MNPGPQGPHDLIRLALVALAGVLGLAGAGLLCLAALHALAKPIPTPWAAALLGTVLLFLSGAALAVLGRKAGVTPVPDELSAPAQPAALTAFFIAFLLSRRLLRRG
jgi:hypothetical protein